MNESLHDAGQFYKRFVDILENINNRVARIEDDSESNITFEWIIILIVVLALLAIIIILIIFLYKIKK